MDFSIFERIGVGALLTAWLIYGTNFLGNVLVDVEEAPHAAAVASAEAPGKPAAPEPEVDFATVLASADPAGGERVFNKCKSCHSIEQGGPNKVGPNLHGVVGHDIAAHEGFSYSDALAGLDGEWTYEKLNEFLTNPKAYAPGTKMTFAGLSKPQDRAEVILYLRENTENPPPLPEPEPQVAAAEPTQAADAAPAEGGAEQQPATGEQGTEQQNAAQQQGTAEGGGEQQQAATQAGEDASGQQAPAEGQSAEGAGGLMAMISAASPDEGQKVFRKCQACHTAEQGGGNRVGPNLYNVVGRDKASGEGYNYSSALTDLEGKWTYQDLDEYLKDPRGYAPGTKMTFPGLKKEEDRAEVISFLRQHADSPPPLE